MARPLHVAVVLPSLSRKRGDYRPLALASDRFGNGVTVLLKSLVMNRQRPSIWPRATGFRKLFAGCVAIWLMIVGSPVAFAGQPLDPDTLPDMTIGLAGVPYYASALPFANVLLLESRGWRFADTGAQVPVSELDTNGFPVALAGRTVFAQPFQNNGLQPAYPVGRYTITWQGDGDVTIASANATLVEGSSALRRRVYVVSAASGSGLRIELTGANAPDHVHHVRVWAPDPADPQQQSLEPPAGTREQQIHPSYIEHLTETPGLFGVIRFMDWGSTNASPQVEWSHRRPPEHAFASGARTYKELITPGTTNSLGDIGVPYERMIETANAAGMDAWICIPHAASDDYVRNLARLFRYGSDQSGAVYTSPQADPYHPPLLGNLRLWVEHSNEIWSGGGAFPQGDWARAQAAALGIPYGEFNGRRAGEIWQIFNEVWRSESGRIIKPAGAFTGNPAYTRQWLDGNIAHDQASPTDTRANVLAVTTYFGQPLVAWAFNERLFMDADLTNPLTDAAILRGADYLLNELVLAGTATGGEREAATGGFGSSNRDLAVEYGLPLVAYEGNSSMYTESVGWYLLDAGDPDLVRIVSQGTPGSVFEFSLANYVAANFPDDTPGNPFDADRLTKFVSALNRHPAFASAYIAHLVLGKSLGLYTHGPFVDAPAWGKFGSWGHKEFQLQSIGYGPGQAAKWQALIDFQVLQSGVNEVGVGSMPTGIAPHMPDDQRLATVLAGQPIDLLIPTAPGDGVTTISMLAGSLPNGIAFSTDPTSAIRLVGTVAADTESRDHRFLVRSVDGDGDADYAVYSIRTVQAGELTQLFRFQLRDTPIGTSSILGIPDAPGIVSATIGAGPGVNNTTAFPFGFLVPGFDSPDLATAIQNEQYLSINMSVEPGYWVDVSNLTLSLGAQNARSFSAALVSDRTGGQVLATWQVNGEAQVEADLGGIVGLQGIACGLEFRVYIYNTTGNVFESFGFSNFGNSPEPEVAVYGSVALGLGCDGGGYDIFEFVSCLAGPGSSTAIGCEGYNLDCDGNIDLADFAVIQSCTNGG